MVALHGGVQAVALELMHEVLRFFEGVFDEDAFAGGVDLEHVEFCFWARPVEDLLKDMGDIFHEVHRVVPANHEVPSFVRFAGFLPGPF